MKTRRKKRRDKYRIRRTCATKGFICSTEECEKLKMREGQKKRGNFLISRKYTTFRLKLASCFDLDLYKTKTTTENEARTAKGHRGWRRGISRSRSRLASLWSGPTCPERWRGLRGRRSWRSPNRQTTHGRRWPTNRSFATLGQAWRKPGCGCLKWCPNTAN